MTTQNFTSLFLFVGLLIAVSPLIARYIHLILEGQSPRLSRFDNFCERLTGFSNRTAMTGISYFKSLLVFNLIGIVFLMLLQLIQKVLPLNPQEIPGTTWHLALNTAVSFVTNTNWQSYSGETAMSYFTQMLGLAVQNFLSAATGIAVAVAFTRGIAQSQTSNVGNFWRDLTRSTVLLLLPLSFIFSILLMGEGVIQNFSKSVTVSTLEGASQTIPQGPVASQEAIKQLGTNGGGFFNANSAHPYENPTPFSNFLQMWMIFLIPAALPFVYGRMVRSKRQGWTIFSCMMVLFLLSVLLSLWSELSANSSLQVAQNLEGKETRFGIFDSTLFSAITTSASCGAINSLHSSLTPLSGGIALLNMMLGEIIFGGVGAGLYGMLLFFILTIFLSGLMIGRSPEIFGKKIEAQDIKWTLFGLLLPSVFVLIGTSLALLAPSGISQLSVQGPHGFSEVLYAMTSAANNNGSAFAGLSANSIFYNVILAVLMLAGRFGVIFACLQLASSLSIKVRSQNQEGRFEPSGVLFGGLLIGVILIVGGLTFLPSLALGPIVEHIMMISF